MGDGMMSIALVVIVVCSAGFVLMLRGSAVAAARGVHAQLLGGLSVAALLLVVGLAVAAVIGGSPSAIVGII